MKFTDLQPDDCPEFFQTYLRTLPDDAELMPFLERQSENFPNFLESIPEDKWDYRYSEGKWSVAEVLGHVYDAERVFQYRALRFGRKDEKPLQGFDQDTWVGENPAGRWSVDRHIEEYKVVRAATLSLFRDFSETDLRWRGTASGVRIGLGALGFIICGHQRHHRNILRNRYLGV